MQLRKISLSALLLLMLIFNIGFSGIASEAQVSQNITVHFDVPPIPTVTGEAVLSIYDGYDGSFIDTQVHKFIRGEEGFYVTFKTNQYEIGKKFFIRLISGAESVSYCGKSGDEFTLETYSYPDSNGILTYQTTFYMGISPYFGREAQIHIAGQPDTTYPHIFVGDKLFVSADIFPLMGVNYSYDEPSSHISLSCGTEGYSADFYIGNVFARCGNREYNLESAPFLLDGIIYLPFEDIAVYFACSYRVTGDDGYIQNISAAYSVYSNTDARAKFVNSKDLSSKTDYLIWISKSSYTVNVFVGENKNWRFINSFPCAIGAPSTPTVEGQFEYYMYQKCWNYDNFYCGPIMRFHNGYAIHSTLLKYNGGYYDNRVGMKISHGCVRVRPDGINWLASYIPLHTKIYVTA